MNKILKSLTIRSLAIGVSSLLSPPFVNAGQPGLPPADLSYDMTIPAKSVFYACEFDIRVSVEGKAGLITLPGNRFVYTSPAQSATVINLSDPQKEVTLNITGITNQSTDSQGDQIFQPRGRNLLGDPGQTNDNGYEGLVLAIGNFTYIFDFQGNLIQPLKGQGSIIKICDLIR